MQAEGTVLSKSVRQRASMKKSSAASASISDTQTNLESGKAAKNALAGIVSGSVIKQAGTISLCMWLLYIPVFIGAKSSRHHTSAWCYHQGTRLHCLRVQSKRASVSQYS